jgi:hypothetical protein
MSAIIDCVPQRLHDGPAAGDTWRQPLHSIVDVGAYSDAAVFVHLLHADFDGANAIYFRVHTAPENRDGRYAEVTSVTVPYTVTLPYTHMLYLTSKGDGGEYSGLDRFMRIEVEFTSGNMTASYDVRALMRQRR